MTKNTAKIQLKVGDVEITIEGSPDYVQRQYRKMEKELGLQDRIRNSAPSKTSAKASTVTSGKRSKTTKSDTKKSPPKEFGNWLHILPKGLKKRDYALVAAYFIQSKSNETTFRTRDVNSTLKANNIKVANPSVMIQNLAAKGEVIKQIKKEGRQKHFQFTTRGEKYIQGLLRVKDR